MTKTTTKTKVKPAQPAVLPVDALGVLAARDDLTVYGDNAILLFALELALPIDDIHSVAAIALTDSSNDKSCDLLWVDASSGRAILAQGYFAHTKKPAAPSDKAARLHQAVGWILGRKSDGIPPQLLSAAQELWAALDAGEINTIEVWYCHNCPESKNVGAEISSTVNTASALIRQHWPNAKLDVSGREIGSAVLEEMFTATQLSISVRDEVSFVIPGEFEELGSDWEALCTTIQANDLRALYRDYGTKLFALNVRDYLGLIKSNKNINFNMRESAVQEPGRFFAYNNGLTILTSDWALSTNNAGERVLRVSGIAIVNGAQTTGVIGNLADKEAAGLDGARILARFVKSNDADVLRNIIQFNNSQNQIEAADFRSNDEVQERLRLEFAAIPDADYRGGRRGGHTDVIERPANLISTKTAAQALACFHGDPTAAYHEIQKIWSDNDYYLRTFSPEVSARHVLFCHSLLKAVEHYKIDLAELETPTAKQKEVLDFLRLRGGGFMLASAIASNLEEICGFPVANAWGYRFKENLSPSKAVAAWMTVVPSLAEFSSTLTDALVPNFRSIQRRDTASKQFSAVLGAVLKMKADTYKAFGQKVEAVAPVGS